MNEALITSRTEGQEDQYKRVIGDAAKKGIEIALKKINPDRDGIQRFLECGDEMASAITEVIIAKTGELSLGNRFADEEVPSKYGYFSGYKKSAKIKDQIDILRSYWSELNPDLCLKYFREQYSELQIPDWVEGPFTIIKQDFLSDEYGEELEEVLKALKKAREGKFVNCLKGKLSPEYLRQSRRTIAKLQQVAEVQGNSDILLLPAQFGIRHGSPIARSVRWAREVFVAGEFGIGAKNIATMLITNQIRLKHFDDLWIDCSGDEYRFGGSGRFDNAPCFCFVGGCIRLHAYGVGNTNAGCGSASAFWQ